MFNSESVLSTRLFLSLVTIAGLIVGYIAVPNSPAFAESTNITVVVTEPDNENDSDTDPNPVVNTIVSSCQFSVQTQTETCVTALTDSEGVANINAYVNQGFANIEAGGSQTNYSIASSSIEVLDGIPQYNSGQTYLEMTLSPTLWTQIILNLKDSASQTPVQGQYVSFNGGSQFESGTTNSSGQVTVDFDTTNGTTTSVDASVGQGNYDSKTISIPLTRNPTIAEMLVDRTSFGLSGVVTYNNNIVGSRTFSYTVYNGVSSVCKDFIVASDGTYSISNVESTQFSFDTRPCNEYEAREYDWVAPFTYQVDEEDSQEHDIVLTKTGVELSVTENGRSVPYLEVRVTDTTNPSFYQTAVTNAAGVALFVGLQPGSYISSYTSSQPSNQKYENVANFSAVNVTNNNLTSDSLEVVRKAGYPATPVVVSGTIVTGLNNTPVANARVSANWWSGTGNNQMSINISVRTDDQGQFEISELPYGSISLSISADGFRSAYTSLNATESTNSYTRNLNLRPLPLGNLTYSGVLEDSDGNPIANRQVSLWASGGQNRTVTSDNSGAFSFTGLAEGIYFLGVDTWSDSLYERLNWQYSYINLTGNDTGNTVVLTNKSLANRNASVSGYVASYVDTQGVSGAVPMAGKNVYIWPMNGGESFSTVTAADGTWSVSNLPEDVEYYVSVQYDYELFEYPQQFAPVISKSTNGIRHELLLKEVTAGTGSLTGRVKDSSNYRNLNGITVSLYRSYGGYTSTPITTNASGEYSFTGLPAGEYFMVVGDNFQSYKDAYMSAEIGTGPNRINALLTPIAQHEGVIRGTVLDDRGIALSGASVTAWNPLDSTQGGWAQTESDGTYEIQGVPTGVNLNFKITSPWDLRYEVASFFDQLTVNNSVPELVDVQLSAAAIISGRVSGIPSEGNVPAVSAELIDESSGLVIDTTWIDATQATYSITSVPAGTYKIRFTQRPNYSGYTGGGGGAGGYGYEGEIVSLKPVYFDGTLLGTSNPDNATVITVASGAKLGDKSVTMTKGATIKGTVYVETPDGTSKLTGTRSVFVQAYQEQGDGTWSPLGFPEAINGFTNSEIQIAGLTGGSYKLKFEDSRRGNNSFATVFNGQASSLADAPEILIEDEGIGFSSITMRAAPPELSADAFDLDELGTEVLAELEGEIVPEGDMNAGSEELLYVGLEFAGEYVAAFANSTPVALGSWKQVDSEGYISVIIPSTLSGSHRIAVQDANQQVIGWSAIEVSGSERSAELSRSDRGSTTAKQVRATNSTSQEIIELSKVASSPENTDQSQSVDGVASELSSEKQEPLPVLAILGILALVGSAVLAGIWIFRYRKS